jgi:hypothetical protein
MTSDYARLRSIKWDVNTRRYNGIVLKRKLRLASFVSAVRLKKGFHNHPKITQ